MIRMGNKCDYGIWRCCWLRGHESCHQGGLMVMSQYMSSRESILYKQFFQVTFSQDQVSKPKADFQAKWSHCTVGTPTLHCWHTYTALLAHRHCPLDTHTLHCWHTYICPVGTPTPRHWPTYLFLHQLRSFRSATRTYLWHMRDTELRQWTPSWQIWWLACVLFCRSGTLQRWQKLLPLQWSHWRSAPARWSLEGICHGGRSSPLRSPLCHSRRGTPQ